MTHAYVESGHDTRLLRDVFCVPIACNLHRVLFVEHWIKDGLPGEPRRECKIAGFANQTRLLRSNRSVQSYCFFEPWLRGEFDIQAIIDL